jgi:hypothetical protein
MNPTFDIFMSAQQTTGAFAVLDRMRSNFKILTRVDPGLAVLASSPQFNVRNVEGVREWRTVITESTSVPMPPLTKSRLFDQVMAWLSEAFPGDAFLDVLKSCRALSTFELERMTARKATDRSPASAYGKIDAVLNDAEIPEHVRQNVRKFCDDYRTLHTKATEQKTPLDEIQSEWHNYMLTLHPNYEQYLHYDLIMQLFGMNEDEALATSKKITHDSRGNEATIGHEVLRIIAGACVPVNLTGSAADVANLLVLLTHEPRYPATLDELRAIVKHRINTAFIDGEKDDILALLLLLALRRKVVAPGFSGDEAMMEQLQKIADETPIHVVLQVPQSYDASHYSELFRTLGAQFEILEDPDSGNIQALKRDEPFVRALTAALRK